MVEASRFFVCLVGWLGFGTKPARKSNFRVSTLQLNQGSTNLAPHKQRVKQDQDQDFATRCRQFLSSGESGCKDRSWPFPAAGLRVVASSGMLPKGQICSATRAAPCSAASAAEV